MANFEKLNVWKLGIELAKDIHLLCKNNKNIKNDWGLKDQVRRSTISISGNIAEGSDRSSDKDFRKFLYIAKGSCGELKTYLYIMKEIEYISGDECNKFIERIEIIHKMLNSFINKLTI